MVAVVGSQVVQASGPRQTVCGVCCPLLLTTVTTRELSSRDFNDFRCGGLVGIGAYELSLATTQITG
jgi:hypothetical protein